MSSSIAIPKRKGKHAAVSRHSVDSSSPSRCTSSSSSSPSSASVHTYKFTPSANRFEYGSYGSNSSSVKIFLPSYADYHFDDLERRQDPVQDIILTEEEIKNMFPS
ncbi:hypothetical protein PTRG_11620 [Pyrenophora tritici-repentis Pt-1C-BFP]|uniref:Uncharacterized protein n=1 Tax=Pyrenophora tritici-repentis (strain Pt-1C-BFP) TaxID=426418 RepID=B2WNR0_PYRTR|nr:uncharacterized protein PTRG_11620 [Pyrenophora tritici-repentis Pt-1C-BFP]EDU44670.1 hypothetical protein PTRG_11620 [Pyrenophora tritici-repentis Pt-1C-BFP]